MGEQLRRHLDQHPDAGAAAAPALPPLRLAPASAPPASDEALLARWRTDGDRAALGELFERHLDLAYRVAQRFLGRSTDAEDAVQAAFLLAMDRADQHRDGASVRAWLMATVANCCRMRAREETRRREREAKVAAERGLHVADRAGRPLDQAELQHLLAAALDELPVTYRVPVWMRYREGLSCAEVAVALDLPDRTVRNHIDRGLDLLRRSLAGSGYAVGAGALLALITAVPAAGASATLAAGLAVGTAVPAGLAAGGAGAAAAAPAAVAAAGGVAFKAGVLGGLGLLAAGSAAGVVLATGASTPPAATAATAPAAATAAAPVVPTVASSALAAVLDQRVDLALDQVRLSEAMVALERALPAGSRLGVAITQACERGGWAGFSRRFSATPVRGVLDAIAADLGLCWQAAGGIVLWSRPAPADLGAQAAVLAAAPAPRASRLAAIAALGESGRVEALRALVLASGEADAEVANRSLDAAFATGGASWSTRSERHPLAALAGDAAVDAVLRARVERERAAGLDARTICLCAHLAPAWAAEPLFALLDAPPACISSTGSLSFTGARPGATMTLALVNGGSGVPLRLLVDDAAGPRAAAHALIAMADARIHAGLAERLRAAPAERALAIATALACAAGPDDLPLLRSLLALPDAEHWTAVLHGLGRTGDAAAVPLLVAAVRDAPAGRRSQAAALVPGLLAAIDGADAAEALLALLRAPPHDGIVRQQIVEQAGRALARLQHPAALPALEAASAPALADAVLPARLRLGSAPARERARRELDRLARAGDTGAQVAAGVLIAALAESRQPGAVDLLIAQAASSRPAWLRRLAVAHLPTTRDARVLPVLRQLGSDGDALLRGAALAAEARCLDPAEYRARQTSALSGDDPEARLRAAQLLGLSGDPAAVDVLISELRGGHAQTRAQAASTLTSAARSRPELAPRVESAFASALADEPDALVRARLQSGLQRLRQGRSL